MIAPTASATEEYDIVILGAGPVGSTLALLLAGTRHRVLLLEQRNLEGYVAFVLGDSSLLNLQQALSHFLDGNLSL